MEAMEDVPTVREFLLDLGRLRLREHGLDEEVASNNSPCSQAAALTSMLQKRGSIQSPQVAKAFRRVDRSAFLPKSSGTSAWDDAPLRAWDDDAQCVVHLSAPSIYATALEALELNESGISFLNIGSGAGYFSALSATILGKNSVHHCVEISSPLVARCRSTFDSISAVYSDSSNSEFEADDKDQTEKTNHIMTQDGELFGRVPELAFVKIHIASCFELCLNSSMHFDRIYVGAGARASDAHLLSRLLKPGGIIVGPFERDNSSFGAQSLLKATKIGFHDSSFQIEELMAVQFAPLARRVFDVQGRLIEMVPAENTEEEEEEEEEEENVEESTTPIEADNEQPPLQSISQEEEIRSPPREPRAALILRGPIWGIDSPELFAPCFADTVDFLRKLQGEPGAKGELPWHVWQHMILPCLAHDDIIDKHITINHKKRRVPCGAICGVSELDFLQGDDEDSLARRVAARRAVTARRAATIARALTRWTLARLG